MSSGSLLTHNMKIHFAYKNSSAIFFKELKGYFYSLSSYIFIIVFLTIITWIYFSNLFLVGQASMRSFFALIPWFFLFLVPALSMRIWSEEKRQGTYETLLVLPISEWEIVAAKFLASFIFLGATLLFSFSIPITLTIYGSPDWGQIIGSYVGAWLLGGAYLALGQYISSLTRNQIVAFLLTIAIAGVFIFVGLPFVLIQAGPLSGILYEASTMTHFGNFSKGMIDLRDVVYYFSYIVIFLYLNVYVLVQRHWK